MSYYSENSSPAFPSPPPQLRHPTYDVTNTPSVVVLETAHEGLLRIKVESDVMAYILYCHYEEFSNIQQEYGVSISWSGMDNMVVFCATIRSDPSLLHIATQRFVTFYNYICSNLVAAPLSNHTTNITLQQYHRATFQVKANHPKAMIKDIKSTGKLALYSFVDEVRGATRTFLNALSSSTPSSGSSTPNTSYSKGSFSTISRPPRSYNSQPRERLESDVISQSSSSPTNQPYYRGISDTASRQLRTRSFTNSSNIRIPPIERMNIREADDLSNASSGYGSNNGRNNLQYSPFNDVHKRAYSDGFYEYQRLPPIATQSALHQMQPGQRHTINRHHNSNRTLPKDYTMYDGVDDYKMTSRYRTMSPAALNRGEGQTFVSNNHLSPMMNSHSNYGTYASIRRPVSNQDRMPQMSYTRKALSPVLPNQISSRIPKLKSPFSFKQNHKVYFQTTTPTGIEIEVHEGDVTDSDCDVIVNETNNQLHVNGELAWAVAKYGAFEIPKLTKLHVAMHGNLGDGKVMVTPSVGLPSLHIIHAAIPKWRTNDTKRCKKLLYNTYKNIFSTANVDLQAESIALPVLGLTSSGNSDDAYPLHIVTEIMYQALIAFLKLGSPSLRHIRFVSNDPEQVNIIVTSIKPKIENVTYDKRFLKQYKNSLNTKKKSVNTTSPRSRISPLNFSNNNNNDSYHHHYYYYNDADY